MFKVQDFQLDVVTRVMELQDYVHEYLKYNYDNINYDYIATLEMNETVSNEDCNVELTFIYDVECRGVLVYFGTLDDCAKYGMFEYYTVYDIRALDKWCRHIYDKYKNKVVSLYE